MPFEKPKVSVLMTVYNTSFFYIKRAIDSVLNQAFQDFELIIIDDGSKKTDYESLQKYIETHEDKIIYLRHRNRGQSESINRGIKISTGEYITIIDSDDEYKPNHLSACLTAISDSDLSSSTAEIVSDSKDDYYVPDRNDLSKLIHLDDTILFGTLFGRKEVFKSIPFKSGFAADADFFEKVEQQFIAKKVHLRTYIYYRNIPTSICSKLKKANLVNL